MNHPVSDAIVFFGATGDLAYKQIFPALQGLIRDEGLDVPIIGVAKAGWSLDQLKARAKDSLSSHGSLDAKAFAKLASLLRYVDGDYNDPSTYVRHRWRSRHENGYHKSGGGSGRRSTFPRGRLVRSFESRTRMRSFISGAPGSFKRLR